MFFGGLTNGFSMVFDLATIAFNGFRWFRTIGQTMRWFRWIVSSIHHDHDPQQQHQHHQPTLFT